MYAHTGNVRASAAHFQALPLKLPFQCHSDERSGKPPGRRLRARAGAGQRGSEELLGLFKSVVKTNKGF